MVNRPRLRVNLGLIIALPVSSFVVAFLWDRGVLALWRHFGARAGELAELVRAFVEDALAPGSGADSRP